MERIIVEPQDRAPLATIVFLHGLGANGHDFEPIAQQLLPILPLRWVLPSAPEIPVTINNGMRMPAWYDITDITRAEGVDWESVAKTKEFVRCLVEAEHLQSPGNPLFLGGFSQGGAISLHTGFDSPVPLAGIIAMSSYLMARQGDNGLPSGLDVTCAPKIFMGHGTWDDVVPPELAEQSHQILQKAGIDVEWHTYPMPHSVCPQELQDLVFWLMARLNIQVD